MTNGVPATTSFDSMLEAALCAPPDPPLPDDHSGEILVLNGEFKMMILRRLGIAACASGLLVAAAPLSTRANDMIDAMFLGAAESGNLETLKMCLKQGAKINSWSGYQGETILTRAIDHNQLEAARFLLDQGAKVSVHETLAPIPYLVDREECSYARCAGLMRTSEFAKLLLEHGADANAKYKGLAPLVRLAENGKLDAVWVQSLKDHRANLNARDEKGRTALMLSVLGGHTDQARLLIEAGADVNARVKDWTALMFAAWLGQADTIDLLVQHGAKTDDSLFAAASAGDLAQVRRLIEKGAAVTRKTSSDFEYIDSSTPFGATALDFAAGAGRAEIVALLLGVKVDDKHDSDALKLAGRYGRTDIIKLLLASGRYSAWDYESMELAAKNNHPEAVLYLLDHGFRVKEALDAACSKGAVAVLEALRARGVVLDPDCLGSVLAESVTKGDLEGSKFALRLGADPHDGLSSAAKKGSPQFIDLLLAAGTVDSDGKASQFACLYSGGPSGQTCSADAVSAAIQHPRWPIEGAGLTFLLDDAEKKRLAAGLIRWEKRPLRAPDSQLVSNEASGWENVSTAAAAAVSADRIAFAGLQPPAAPELTQDEYESRAQFAARVAEARAAYEQTARDFKAKAAAYPAWRRNAILQAVLDAVLEAPKVLHERDYDPDSQTFTPTIVASGRYGKGVRQGFALTDPVPTDKAAEFDAALKDSEPRVVFQLRDGNLSAVSAEFLVLGKTYAALPVKASGASKDLARVELGAAAALTTSDLHVSYADNPELAQKVAELEKLKHDRAATDQLKQLEAEISSLKKGEERTYHSDVDRPTFSPKAARLNDLALVIGIESYQDANLPKASFAERDAQAVSAHLQSLGVPRENIKVLRGQAATAGKIKGYLESWLAKNAKPDSRVYFYFSGHGAPEPESGGAYLVSWDGDPQFLKTTAVSLANVYDDLGKLRVKQVLVAMDACFSGTGGRSVMKKGARPLVAHLHEENEAPPNITILAAAGQDEIAGSFEEQGHGIFTYYLLKGLDDGARDTDALCRYLKPKVSDKAARDSATQTPVCRGPGISF